MQRGDRFADPFLQEAIDSNIDFICLLETNGRIAHANASARRTFDSTRGGTLIGRSWCDLWPGGGRDLAAQAVEAAAEGERQTFRTYIHNPVGEVTCWDCIVSPVHAPGSDVVVGLTSTARDVTVEVHQANLLNAVINHVPAAMCVKNVSDGRFQLVNKALEDLLQRPAFTLIGRTDHEVFTRAEADFFRAKDQELLETGGALLIEQESITGLSGQPRILRTKKVVIHEDRRPRYILCLSEDITDDLRAEEVLKQALADAEAASRAKSEFLANMSHEIRTPLNGVMGVAGALGRTALSHAQQEMVSIIETSAKTLEALLSDILDLARIEAGKMELREETFDLSTSVRAVGALFEAGAEAKGLALEVEVASDALGAYVGDAARLRQILSNLIGNAVKFTQAGKVRLAVSARRGETASQLCFQVSDTGIGFDAETKARLFSRFEQADGSITRQFGGSGLGLSISRALAEAMGGMLEADATPGEGSVFTLTLDLPRGVGALDLWVEEEEAEALQDPLVGMRVLLAEDHPTNRRVVELILGASGVDLTCVENGQEAVDIFQVAAFDLILMDMQMPVMDGLTAIREIRKLEAAAGRSPMPIHVLTANAMPQHIKASLEAGADGHLSKPITADALLDLVGGVAEAIAAPAGDLRQAG